MKNIRLVINNDIQKKEKEKFFIKKELQCILNLYAKMVSNGEWKDYGLSISKREISTMNVSISITFTIHTKNESFECAHFTKLVKMCLLVRVCVEVIPLINGLQHLQLLFLQLCIFPHVTMIYENCVCFLKFIW